MDEEGLEIIEIDENTESVAHVLTLVSKHLDPKIDLGPTYELIVRFLIKMIYEPIDPLSIETTARDLALAIHSTRGMTGKASTTH